MATAKFIDFSQAELRNIVKDHNLHLMIKKYSKLTKSELVKLIETMLFIDSNNRIKIMPKILSKYNEHFKDITPGYIIVKRKFKKAPKEQPKQSTNDENKIKFKKNFGAPIIQLGKEAKKSLKKMKEDDKKAVKIENDEKPLLTPYKKKSGVIIDDDEKPTKPIPKMLENNEIEIKLTLEQIAKIIRSVNRIQPAFKDRMLSILNRMADGQTKFKSFNEHTIKEMIDYL